MEASRTRSVYFVAATLHTYGVAVARAAPRGPHAPGRARDGAGAVLWQDAELAGVSISLDISTPSSLRRVGEFQLPQVGIIGLPLTECGTATSRLQPQRSQQPGRQDTGSPPVSRHFNRRERWFGSEGNSVSR